MKTARETFSEITDIDNRLLKTFIGLFRNPQRVIETSLEGLHTYTKPLRYLLFTSTVFIIWRFSYEHYVQGFFVEQYPEMYDGYLPGRIAKATSQFISLQDNFFPFQILFFVVPLAIIPINLFFLGKSWKEARYVTLYSFGQFWIVLMVFVPLMAAYDTQLFPVLIAFGLIGFFFRKLLSKRIWVGLIKWIVLGYLLTIWFYEVVVPGTQWGLVQIVLPDRYQSHDDPAKPLEEIVLPVSASWVEPIVRDPNHRILAVLEKQEGLLVQCFQPDSTLLWQTLLPGLTGTREALSVQLPSLERGFLLLADAPKMAHALLISAKGKILFTKVYQEEMALNGGDLVNETLVLTGGKSNGEGIAPFIDVLQLKFDPGKGTFETTEERTHFLPGVGNRFDDIYAIGSSTGGLDFVVSRFETTSAKIGFWEINRVSIMRVKVDSTLTTTWEAEIFKRTSKYSPQRNSTFQMRYDPAFQRILAFYSLADDRVSSAHLFSIDTLGRIQFETRIQANELTDLHDVYSARDGIYFCGQTHIGIRSSLLGLGSQGLIGFVSNDGRVSQVTVGKDRQGHYLLIYKIVADNNSLTVWAVRDHYVLFRDTKLELMKFDRHLF